MAEGDEEGPRSEQVPSKEQATRELKRAVERAVLDLSGHHSSPRSFTTLVATALELGQQDVKLDLGEIEEICFDGCRILSKNPAIRLFHTDSGDIDRDYQRLDEAERIFSEPDTERILGRKRG